MSRVEKDNRQTLAALRVKLEELDHDSQRTKDPDDVVSSGCTTLDQSLPQGGFQRGQLVEWLSAYSGSGAASWALQSCRWQTTGAFTEKQQSIVMIDQAGTFYPPAAFGMGIDLERLVIIHPKNSADAMWALDQSLRCPAVAAACAVMPRLDPRDFRRLQLAAEQGNTIGHLLRPLTVRGQPSWSDVQLLIRPQAKASSASKLETHQRSAHAKPRLLGSHNKGCTGPPMANCRTWRIELLRCKGGRHGEVVHVTGDVTTGKWLSPAATDNSPLSNSTFSKKSSSATGSSHAKSTARKKADAVQQSNAMEQSNTMHLAAELARPANARRATRA